jgi:hypothetical protein
MLEGSIGINVNLGRGMLADLKTAISGAVGGLKGSGGGISTGIGGIVGNLANPMLKMVGIMGGIAGSIALLVKSSGILQGVLGSIGKLIMLMVKPLGDILGVALMPLLYIMRPIGTFFNILMRPYIQKAMAAMRAGGAMLQAVDTEGALAAFATGAEYLLKPILDVNVKVFSKAMGGLADIMGTAFANVPFVGDAFKALGDSIRSGGQSFIDTSTNILDTQLGMVLATAQNETGIMFEGMVKSLKDADVSAAFESKAIKTSIVTPLEDLTTWVGTGWGFADAVKRQMQEALGYQGTSYAGGVTFSKPNKINSAAFPSTNSDPYADMIMSKVGQRGYP